MVTIRTTAIAGIAGVTVLALLAGCSDQSTPDNPASPSAGASSPGQPGGSPGQPSASKPPARASALPIYYVADTAAGPRLYREFHAVATDPASDAVREMLAKPTGIDPDYRSHWPAGTSLRSAVQHTGGVITVDLSGEARNGQFGAELAELTVQQLVFTVQGTLQSTDPVRILVDGQQVPELWGHVGTAQPVRRADPYAVRSLVQIDNPPHGANLGRVFTVSGEAAAFEANVLWEVRQGSAIVKSGFTTAAEGQRFSAFSFSLTLDPGEYTVRVVEDDPSGGVGRPPFEDTKVVHVAG